MTLRKSTGNMYEFVTHTWSPIKGKCWHDCSYCYMKKWNLPEIHLDKEELKADLGENNFIFVCSGCDMFAKNIVDTWIEAVLNKCRWHQFNKYLFQTKDPLRLSKFTRYIPLDSIICTTIESNYCYPDIMNNAPKPYDRAYHFEKIPGFKKFITIEPILDFELKTLVNWIKLINPAQVNIGADSKNHNLPEPPKFKILELIKELKKYTEVHLKKNIYRLI